MKSVRLSPAPQLLPGAEHWEGALIFITPIVGEGFFRPAAFVFDLKFGLAWIEPGYADPSGCPSPALHFRFGRRVAPTVFENAQERVEASCYYRECDSDMGGDSMAWFDRWLITEGRSYQAERARMWARVREDARQAIKAHLSQSDIA